ncbi:MAG: GTP cyclohydrolase I FolE [Actinomycetota bacterium]
MGKVIEVAPGLREVHRDARGAVRVDRLRAELAVADLLEALGVDLSNEDLSGTPRRVARMYEELLTPRPFNPTTFENDAGYDEMVIARDIPFTSLCAHHMLPFSGIAHVGYLPGDRIIGLSKLARVVTYFARNLQVQERLTKQVADWLDRELQPRGVGVVVRAEHQCMTIRGIQAAGSTTVTSTMTGLLRENLATREEFLALCGQTP